MARQRRALCHVGGPVRKSGDGAAATILCEALEGAQGLAADELTHGFHAYPARMHPNIARVLVRHCSSEDHVVLDPFCGSGTVAVEALVAGINSIGIDLNPVALMVARVRTQRRDLQKRERFHECARVVAAASEHRVRARKRATAPLSAAERRFFAPHVLLELAGLFEEIQRVDDDDDRLALEVVFSSILVKVSFQRAETSQAIVHKSVGRGVPTDLFVRKATELVQRWGQLDGACRRRAEPPHLIVGDARDAVRLLPPHRPVAAVITSPPYGGTYDYVEHQARRYPWFGIASEPLRRREIGSRSRFTAANPKKIDDWDREVDQVLRAIARVLRRDAPCVLLVGDGQLGGRRIEADRQMKRIAAGCGLRWVATASQPRPDWMGGQDRSEHLIWLTRSESGGDASAS